MQKKVFPRHFCNTWIRLSVFTIRFHCCSEENRTVCNLNCSVYDNFFFVFFPSVHLFKPLISPWIYRSVVDSCLVYVDCQIFWPNRVLEQFVCFVYSRWIFSVKTIGFLVEQCQMALWVFLMAYWVWLVFAIQLLLKKNQCGFFFCFSPNAPHNALWSYSQPQWELREHWGFEWKWYCNLMLFLKFLQELL